MRLSSECFASDASRMAVAIFGDKYAGNYGGVFPELRQVWDQLLCPYLI